jgi:hypothetical protein
LAAPAAGMGRPPFISEKEELFAIPSDHERCISSVANYGTNNPDSLIFNGLHYIMIQ